MSGSVLHQALAGLTATWTGVVQGLDVTDGPNFDPDTFFLAVGWAGRTGSGVPGITSQRIAGNQPGTRNIETHVINCTMSKHVGDPSEVPTVRAAMFAAFDQLDTALRANRLLGVTGVTDTSVDSYDLEQDLDETGSYLYLHIAVAVDTYR